MVSLCAIVVEFFWSKSECDFFIIELALTVLDIVKTIDGNLAVPKMWVNSCLAVITLFNSF